MSGLAWWLSAPSVTIEEAGMKDAAALASIHAASFARDWSEDEIAALLRDETVSGLVVRRANLLGTRSPVAFVLMRTVADEAEILTVACDPRHRGRGHARRLIEALFRRLYHERVKAVFLEVDAGNEPALALYRRLGFRKVGERKGYYAAGSSPGASALVMRADLG
jgi:ribosomal-protein-alanine N-acetyltransferase